MKFTMKRLIFFLIGALLLASCESNTTSPEKQPPPKQPLSELTQPEKTTSVTVALNFLQSQEPSLQRRLGDFALSTPSDISHVELSVSDGLISLITDQPMIGDGVTWTATLQGLPIGPILTFEAIAYDIDGNDIFSGVTHQALNDGGQNITIAMGVDDFQVSLPAVQSISFVSPVAPSSTTLITTLVQGPANSSFNYLFTADPLGGLFTPDVGAINLAGSGLAGIANDYTAPSVGGFYENRLKLIDADNFEIETLFEVEVADGGQKIIQTVFNPWITRFQVGPRQADRIFFQVDADDDQPLSELRFLWEFTGLAGTPSVSFLDPTEQNATLTGYTPAVAGTVTLTITDENGSGGQTMVMYELSADQFPDCIVNCNVPIADAGSDQSIEVNTLVQLDGNNSTDPGGASLGFLWSVLSEPAGSSVTLNGFTTSNASFTPTELGDYLIRLIVDNGSHTDMDTVTITATPEVIQITRPTLQMVDEGNNTYRMLLLSPPERESQAFDGAGGIGMFCEGFANLQPLNGLSSSPVNRIGNAVIFDLFETGSGSIQVIASLELATLTCTSPPSFNLGPTATITYNDDDIISGGENIDTIDP